MTLDEFCDVHLDRLDCLAFRSSKGDALTPEESEELARLRTQFYQLMPPPMPLSDDALEAIAQAHRLLALYPEEKP